MLLNLRTTVSSLLPPHLLCSHRTIFALNQLSMSLRASTDRLLGDVETNPGVEEYTRSSGFNTFDASFSDQEKRRKIEKSLLRKLDWRLSFLILVSLMNYVCLTL